MAKKHILILSLKMSLQNDIVLLKFPSLTGITATLPFSESEDLLFSKDGTLNEVLLDTILGEFKAVRLSHLLSLCSLMFM